MICFSLGDNTTGCHGAGRAKYDDEEEEEKSMLLGPSDRICSFISYFQATGMGQS